MPVMVRTHSYSFVQNKRRSSPALRQIDGRHSQSSSYWGNQHLLSSDEPFLSRTSISNSLWKKGGIRRNREDRERKAFWPPDRAQSGGPRRSTSLCSVLCPEQSPKGREFLFVFFFFFFFLRKGEGKEAWRGEDMWGLLSREVILTHFTMFHRSSLGLSC